MLAQRPPLNFSIRRRAIASLALEGLANLSGARPVGAGAFLFGLCSFWVLDFESVLCRSSSEFVQINVAGGLEGLKRGELHLGGSLFGIAGIGVTLLAGLSQSRVNHLALSMMDMVSVLMGIAKARQRRPTLRAV